MKPLIKRFKLYTMISFISIFRILYGDHTAEAAPGGQGLAENIDHRNEYEVLKYLWPVLKQAKMAGRIDYSASCQSDENYPPPFPKLAVQSPSNRIYGANAAKKIFSNDKNVTVTNKSPGLISINIGNEEAAILQTKISSIRLEPADQYNAPLAISVVENSDDVRAAMHKLGIHPSSRVSNQIIAMPAAGLPHLTSELKNLTMDQALDKIAKTFGGIIFYRACTNYNRFTIDFVGGAGFDESKLQ